MRISSNNGSHDLIGLLDNHKNQEDVDVLITINKQTFKEFHDPVLISSLTCGIMVLLRKSSPFYRDKTEVVTQNCLAVKLRSASNQEIKIAFVYNPNVESDNSSMNFELDYVDHTEDPHKASRNFLHGLQEDGVYIDV